MDHDYTKYRELRNNDVILILGAYNGDFIRERKDEILKKNIFVINIEPDIRLCTEMMDFIRKEMPCNATALNVAVSHKSDIMIFENNVNHLISGLKEIPSMWPPGTEFETKILSFSLDDILSRFKINCIFCDIEGAELEVFNDSIGILDVEYIAIAAYHIRDAKKTFIFLSTNISIFLSNNKNITNKKIIIDGGGNNEEVLYIV